MVIVEICTYSWNAATREFARAVDTRITAHGDSLEITGNDRLREIKTLDPSTGAVVTSEQPERWARLLPHAFRSGQIVAEVVRDDVDHELAS